ncbi:MAG: hypothetical protein MMC33_009459 [Icmadophila ericetorum]|nr:hypothetical protein [Icmadophila ericetorum]
MLINALEYLGTNELRIDGAPELAEVAAHIRKVNANFQTSYDPSDALGRDHTSTLYTIYNLAILYKNQGRLAEAEAMYNRALEGKEKALGREHTSTLDTVNNLAALYSVQGRLAEAEDMFNRALEGKEKALGREHTSTLTTITNLAILYRTQGRLDEAETMFARLSISK